MHPTQRAASHAAAKQIPIQLLLGRLGLSPVGEARGGNFYYLSPFRDEQTPSFVVSAPKNVWTDFGEEPKPGQKAAGGDVLDLVMRLTGLQLPEARQALFSWAADLPELATPAPRAAGHTVRSGPITFHEVQTEPLTWNSLIGYLTARGIDWGLVRGSARTLEHLQQIFYRVEGQPRPKPYFGLAWKTAAGWEVRSKGFQSCIGGKGLTWLPGTEPGVAVFEGFVDYLSALTHFRTPAFRCTVLVLNSVSLLGEALPRLREAPWVRWFGDNDAAGLRALRTLRAALPAGRVRAENDLYRGFKDFNDFLTKTPPNKPLPPRGAEPSKQALTARYWLWAVFAERAPGTPAAAGKKRTCTFYAYTNDAEGLAQLRVLRNQLGDQLAYYRLCERTQGREFNILEWAGAYAPQPVVPGAGAPAADEEETD